MKTSNSSSRFLQAALCAAIAHAFATVAFAEVTLAPLFRDGAVLQRDQPLPVWGRAAAGETIRVQFHDQSAATAASADGRWRVTLKAEKASAQSSELTVAGTNTVRVRDVLVGDVWLCGGQSNMEFRLAQANNAEAEIAAANLPLIRHFKIPHTVADAPAADCVGQWAVCSPATAGDFTAIGFFFARDLHQRLGVPIGLVNSNWGGTQIESWMSDAALKADPAATEIFARWQKVLADYPAKVAAHEKAVAKWKEDAATTKAAGKPFTRRQPVAPEGPGSRWQPSGMYHAMIAPLEPAALRGVLWYQGEANGSRAPEYRTLFPGLIRQWRADFAQPNLPFYFVQLANFARPVDKSDQEWPLLREAQAMALALPATGMAVTIDIGDPTNIHPKNKQEVGRRLALVARAQIFGEKIEFAGPLFAAATPEGGALRVTFTHAAGLAPVTGALDGFEVAGDDQKFVPAVAHLEDDAVIVSGAAVPAPVAVRYSWHNNPVVSLVNAAGLPASPFRSDTW